jgi:Rhodopirellula transposase DDE domain
VEITAEELKRFFGVVNPHLNEVQRRVVAGAMANVLGRGGKTAVSDASGMSRNTVIKAVSEVDAGIQPSMRLRPPGAGAKPLIETQPGLLEALDELVHPDTRGNPMSLLRWTAKSTGHLAGELVRQGYKITDDTVGKLLKQMGFSLQATSKQKEGSSHPDRDEQFRHINKTAGEFMKKNEPVVSVDTKKKELVGDYGNRGQEWQVAGEPEKVNTYDFPESGVGKAVPYGIYDVANNEGWVSVGDSGDTSAFAINAIRTWWNTMGKQRFPEATRLLICADGGGSNGHRVRAWKTNLAILAKETGLDITVAHYPPGTSKWNKIEHRMFSFITMNWRGRPLDSYRTVVELIGSTTTKTGLRIKAARDEEFYETGIKVTDEQLAAVPLRPHKFHGDWNYTVLSNA